MNKSLIFLIMLLCSVGIFAQNTDKSTSTLTTQNIHNEVFENTIDAIRATFTDGHTYVLDSIAASASLSDSIFLGDRRLIAVIVDAGWTTANLTFQTLCEYDSTWRNIYTYDGTELTYTAATSRWIVAKPTDFAGVKYLKVRSGTSGSAVTQASGRRLILVLRRY